MNFRRIKLNSILISAIFMLGCGSVTDVKTTNGNVVANISEANKNSTVDSFRPSKKVSDQGDFLVEHNETRTARFKPFEQKIREDKMFEKAADKLNGALTLPYDVVIRTKDCNEVNSLYDSADHSITICFELPEHFYKLFRKKGYSEEESHAKMFDAVRFAFLHELGHALIDAYQIPLTGNEEDAADRLSGYICLEEMGESGKKAIVAAAEAFKIEAETEKPADFSDEHLLEEQRFYTTLCLIYGSDPEKYKYLVSRDYLPAARADRCPNEYQKMVQSWSEFLLEKRKD